MAKGVTIESLAQRIAELESRPRSLNEDFQLEAYRMLASRLVQDLLVCRSPRNESGWINVSEREPDYVPGGREYLVFETLNNRVQHDYWNVPGEGDPAPFIPFWNHYGNFVTHWCLLPPPPVK